VIRPLSLALATLALLVALGGEAAASECHKNCNGGYLAMTALVAGSLAVGSAALGTRVGGSAALKRVEHAEADAGTSAAAARVDEAAPATEVPPRETPIERVTPETPATPPRDAHESAAASAAAQAPTPVTAPDTGANVVKHGSEYAGKLAKEMAPHGGTIDSGLGVAQKVIANEDRVAGLAEGLTDAADVVKDATKVTPPAPGVGATVRYCPSCGTKTREGARFCAQCGTRLG
jgi:hypothetical protein